MTSDDSHSQTSHNKSRRASVAVAPGEGVVPPAFGASANDPVANYALGYEAELIPEQDDGVTKIEALYLVFSGWKIWLLYGSLAVFCYMTSLSGNTTYIYEGFATSAYQSHSLVGTIAVAVSIIGGVAKPFIAKIADIASRPTAFTIVLAFYVIGYIIIASSSSVNAVAAGQVLSAVGNTGFDILVTILIGDITSLQWRGLATSISASPYVINAFVAGSITEAVSTSGWRWGVSPKLAISGALAVCTKQANSVSTPNPPSFKLTIQYGMFCILMPVAILPLLVVLFWASKKAKRVGALSLASSQYARRQEIAGLRKRSHLQMAVHYIKLIDALGLLLLGFGVALVLLPLTIYSKVSDSWRNPSIIAMFVVGGLCLIAFSIWEYRFSPHPIMPSRLWNRTMWCCIAIDLLYYFSFYVGAGFFTSFVYILKPEWSLRDYTYWSNTLGVALTVFAVMAGALQRYFHNYKYIQLTGLCIRVIGVALIFYATQGHCTTAVFVSAQVISGLGGAMSVIGSQVAVQASVPHQDMGIASANLALWTSVGGAIGNAIGTAMWNDRVPKALTKYLSNYYDEAGRAEIFGSIVVAQAAEPRDLVAKAYQEAMWLMSLIGLILTLLPLIPGVLTTNFYLGTNHNAIEPEKHVIVRLAGESDDQYLARGMAANEQRHAEAQREEKDDKGAERAA